MRRSRFALRVFGLGLAVLSLNLAAAASAQEMPSDDERLAPLKAELTQEEALKIVEGKRWSVIGCGPLPRKQADGQFHATTYLGYEFFPSSRRKVELGFTYWDGKIARISGTGGLRYVRKGDKLVRIDWPPKRPKIIVDLPHDLPEPE